MRSSLPILLTKIVNVLMSACMCVFGITVIATPAISEKIIGLTAGILLILLGIFKLAGYFSKDLFRLAFQYDLQLGIILIMLGVGALTKTEEALQFVCAVFGTAVFVDGIFKTAIAVDSKKFGIKPWYVILLFAVITCIIGAVSVFIPSQSVRALTIILGAALIAEGMLHLTVILCTVKVIDHQMPDNLSD